MDEKIQDIYLTNKKMRKKWQAFLEERGIKNFAENEVNLIQQTIGIFNEQDELIATGSLAGNVIKYVAVCDAISETKGARFNKIISELENRLSQVECFHYFVYTKPMYQKSFEHVGFKLLAATSLGILMEKGTPNITDYIASIPHFPIKKRIASIVMNANPFTKGHRFLVEKAASENDYVYVFVVNQDASLFKTNERIELIKRGTADLKNVVVVNGGDYMVSYVSFASYFIKNTDQIIKYQTMLDAKIFKNNIIKPLGITSRYLGSEPFSHTTSLYNDALKKELGNDIQVIIVPRKKISGVTVSATKVREAIATGNFGEFTDYVPKTTADYIIQNMENIQLRIRERAEN